jgi:hypothetical protein
VMRPASQRHCPWRVDGGSTRTSRLPTSRTTEGLSTHSGCREVDRLPETVPASGTYGGAKVATEPPKL